MATVTPSDSTPTAVVDAINIVVTAADPNTSTGYDPEEYPASPAINYYLSIEKSGSDSLVSEVFSTNFDETHTWPSVIIPEAGTWTAHLRLVEDDSSVANATITAS